MTPAMIVPHLPTLLLEDFESLSSRSEPEAGGVTRSVGFVAEAILVRLQVLEFRHAGMYGSKPSHDAV